MDKHAPPPAYTDTAAVDVKDDIDKASVASLSKGEALAVDLPPSLAALSEEERALAARRATRKVDLMLIPPLTVLYLLNFLDRQNLSSAKVAGIAEDLRLTTAQYATCVAVLFAGYVALQVPCNMLASRLARPGLWICANAATWGVVSACTGAVRSYAGLAVCRALLGVVEAAFFPGAIFLVSLFYTRRQVALRAAAFYTGSQAGNAFGGLFAVGILTLDGAHGLAGWRWLFVVEGALTFGIALLCALVLPDRPERVRWLTPTEKEVLLHRLAADHGEADTADAVPLAAALRMALVDPKTWLLCATLQCAFVAATVTNFFPLVTQGLGFGRTATLALTAPPYVLCALGLLLNGWSSDRTANRSYHIAGPMCLTLLGNTIAVATTAVAPRYLAMCLLPVGFYAASTIVLSWVAGNVTGPSTKRAIVFAVLNACAQVPNIWSSYLYFAPPRYVAAFAVNLAASALCIAMALVTRAYFRRENAKMDRGEDTGPNGPSAAQLAAGFRYQL